jgi:hypothetical protein
MSDDAKDVGPDMWARRVAEAVEALARAVAWHDRALSGRTVDHHADRKPASVAVNRAMGELERVLLVLIAPPTEDLK